MKNGWIVTKSYIEGSDYDPNNLKAEDIVVIGPRNCELSKEELLNGHPFKMFDDDNNLYYEGFFVGDKESEDGFMPLDHYGTPNAGCTMIFYKDDQDQWKQL